MALFAFVPATASAHAQLEGSTPAGGAEVQRGPDRVTVRFDDGITIGPGSLHVLDAAGTDRARGVPYHPRGNADDVEVRTPHLPRGQYTVVWQIVADDGHVGDGRFAFGVGVPAAVLPAAPEASASAATTAIVAVLRFFLLAGLLTGAGLAAGAGLVVRAPNVAPVSMLEFAAWLVAAFVALVDTWAQSVVTDESLGAVLSTRYGVLHVTIALAALGAVIAISGGRRNWDVLITCAIVALAAEAFSGHGATGVLPALGVIFDAGHLAAAAWWIGLLLTTLLATDIVDVRRVSAGATYAVAVVLITSVAQVLRNVASIGQLVTTPYGLEVCAKIVLLAVAGAIALQSRRRLAAGAVAVARTVRLEVLVLCAVVVVTAVLVDSHPPR